MTISIIVAKSINGVIGNNNRLIWHLPNDLKHFKQKTLGHHLLVGRKTFESIGKPLLNRKILLLTKNTNYQPQYKEVQIVSSIQESIQIAKNASEAELFIIGGETVYQQALPFVNKIYLTAVETYLLGDVYFPNIDNYNFIEIYKERHWPDEQHAYPYSFIQLIKK